MWACSGDVLGMFWGYSKGDLGVPGEKNREQKEICVDGLGTGSGTGLASLEPDTARGAAATSGKCFYDSW